MPKFNAVVTEKATTTEAIWSLKKVNQEGASVHVIVAFATQTAS